MSASVPISQILDVSESLYEALVDLNPDVEDVVVLCNQDSHLAFMPMSTEELEELGEGTFTTAVVETNISASALFNPEDLINLNSMHN